MNIDDTNLVNNKHLKRNWDDLVSPQVKPTDAKIKKIKDHIFPYNEILSDLKKYKPFIPNYKTANKTIRSIEILQQNMPHLKRENLTEEVYKLTGIAIHAKENYPSISRFEEALILARKDLLEAYKNAKNPAEKILFFKLAFESGGCFEARVEEIVTYLENTKTLEGLLRLTIYELNLLKEEMKANPVKLEELIDFLHKMDFFNTHPITEDDLRNDRAIQKLKESGLLESDAPKPINVRIEEALMVYPDIGQGKGRAAFEEYLRKNSEFSKEEQRMIAQLLDAYLSLNPDKKQWI